MSLWGSPVTLGGGSADCWRRVRYYNNAGTTLLNTEYVRNGEAAVWGTGKNWSLTPGGTASGGVLDNVRGDLDVYRAIAQNSYVIEGGGMVETFGAAVELNNGGLYFFTTVYSGSSFTGVSILAGSTSAVYNATGYDRVACFIRANSAAVTYNRYGSIATNKYSRFRVYLNGASLDSDVTLALGSTSSASGSFAAEAGKLYRVLTGVGDVTGSFTGGTVILQNTSGDTGKQNLNALVAAESSTIAYSGGGTLYYTPVTVYVNGTEVPYLYGD